MKNKKASTGGESVQSRTREIPPTILEMARVAFKENLKMNAAKREYEGQRKALLGGMESSMIKEFRTQGTDLEGKPVTIDATVGTPMGDVISISKLLAISFPTILTAVAGMSLDDQKKFYGMLSATKASVTAYAGSIVVTQATVSVAGNRNVFIKAAK